MLDIRLIRQDPENVRRLLVRRGGDAAEPLSRLLEIDADRRATETRLQEIQAERNRLSKEIGKIRAAGGPSGEIEAAVKDLGEEMKSLNEQSANLAARQNDVLLAIPNLPHEEAPEGTDESANPVLRTFGERPAIDSPRDHMEIAGALGLLDPARAAKVSGSGFACFRGRGARLERALLQWLLDFQTLRNGYTEISPPFLVRRDCMVGTGQLPKFEDDMYGVDGGGMFLAPTAEVPVTNLHRDEILPAESLPLKYAAYTPCFRREAGSAGRETKGLIRMHQFDKVELVRICRPEDSASQLEALTADAESILQALGLHYRVVELCTGDLGFGAARTYDLEVWAPGQQAYLEVSSCSNFTDFQARRMGLRFKSPRDKKPAFCHTLNGSGTALPRLYVAILESGQQPDGSVRLPEPLAPYFGSGEIRPE